MVDPEDVTAITLDFALRELRDVANAYSDPDFIWREWFTLTLAVIIAGNVDGWSFHSILLLTARRVVADARALL